MKRKYRFSGITGQMGKSGFKSMVYAVKLSTMSELLNYIIDASTHTKNEQQSLLRSVTSISRSIIMCTYERPL
jgi:hypothetical protein